jgi:hypothetical protein
VRDSPAAALDYARAETGVHVDATGRDIRGGEPGRAIEGHNSAMPTQQDV